MNLSITANRRVQQTRWPEILAFAAALVFSLASAGTNLIYGWNKGTDAASSVVWAGVSVAISVVFALSWPALMLAIEQRNASRVVATLFALLLCGSYSVTAALGSASGGRANAATIEQSVTEQRARARAAYDSARAELAALKPARSVGELEALLATQSGQLRGKGCAVVNGTGRLVCPRNAALVAELGRAKRRADLEAHIETARGELERTKPARQANSDAAALAGYLAALGIAADVDTLNRLLVLLAVLSIECGGGLALSVGMALQQQTGAQPVNASSVQAQPEDTRLSSGQQVPGHARTPQLDTGRPAAIGAASACPVASTPESAARLDTSPATLAGVQFLAYLRERGGVLVCGQRAMGEALGWSKSWTNVVLHELASAGLVKLTTGKAGTIVQLAA